MFVIRKKEPPVGAAEEAAWEATEHAPEISAGLDYVTGHTYLREIAACTGISNLFGNVLARS